MSIKNGYDVGVFYSGGARLPASSVKNTAPDNSAIYRLPGEDFKINATLTVAPGEEALLVKGGSIGQVFESGTYTLSPQSYSFISRLRNLSTGGMNAFNCNIYFVRKTMSIKTPWRTLTSFHVRDRGVGLLTELHARGTFKFEIEKPRKFLTCLLDNNIGNINKQGVLEEFYAKEFQGIIKASIIRSVNKTGIELLELEKQLAEFSYVVQIFLSEAVKDYGLKAVSFQIAALDNDEV